MHPLDLIAVKGAKLPAIVAKNKIRRKFLQDFKHLARQMHLKYVSQGQSKTICPFHVRYTWDLSVQSSSSRNLPEGR